jgi:hypothetical protein
MNIENTLAANETTIRDFLSGYLPTEYGSNVWHHDGVCISAKKVARRNGVPPDADAWHYTIEEPEVSGWRVGVRAVWRQGHLMHPLTTHVAVEEYESVDGFAFASTEAIVAAANEWLQTL